MLNHFPVKGSISETICPTTIMIGYSLHFKKYLDLHIEQYFQLNEEDTPQNSNHPCTKGSICMGPSRNIQVGFKFMSLRSMKNIIRRYLYMILMPGTVIEQVDLLGKYQKRAIVVYLLQGTTRWIWWCQGHRIRWEWGWKWGPTKFWKWKWPQLWILSGGVICLAGGPNLSTTRQSLNGSLIRSIHHNIPSARNNSIPYSPGICATIMPKWNPRSVKVFNSTVSYEIILYTQNVRF